MLLGAAAAHTQPSAQGPVLQANAGRLRAQTTAPAQPPPTPRGPARLFGGVNEDRILDAIRNGHIDGRRAVGSTSVNFYLDLTGDIDAAFKPCYTDPASATAPRSRPTGSTVCWASRACRR